MNVAEINRPIVVDLDGTLIKTDLLIETANELLARNPLSILKILVWLHKGRTSLKKNLAENSSIDPASLPYNEGLISWLTQQKGLNRKIVLATASDRLLANKVATHLRLFDDVIATEEGLNLKSVSKRDALVNKFGEQGFDYIGNEKADFPIWKAAAKAYVVSSSKKFIDQAEALGNMENIFSAEKTGFGTAFFKLMRPHQWIKNILIFVTLLASHRFVDAESILNATLAFIVFGITASAVYILNDLIDIENDRHHLRKRFRPFAAGNLSLLVGWIAWPFLVIAAFLMALELLPLKFIGSLGVYFLLTISYSLKLKQIAMLDVLTLAGLYTIRIVAGAAAIVQPLSYWMLAFSIFIFLSLAFIKRFSELKSVRHNGHQGKIRGRGYLLGDLELVSSMGSSAGYMSVLVLALYINDSHTAELYAFPEAIWLACPILLFWISRAWLIAHRGEMHDDPIVFAIKDRVSWAVGACFLSVFLIAMTI